MIELRRLNYGDNDILFVREMFDKWGWKIVGDRGVKGFVKGVKDGTVVLIGAYKKGGMFGFLSLFNFDYINSVNFTCATLGAAKPGNGAEVEEVVNYVLGDLFNQGCLRVDLETRSDNLPTRGLARRLGFKFKCELEGGASVGGKIVKTRLYSIKGEDYGKKFNARSATVSV